MKVRALDSNGDWLFGKGLQDYYINRDAVAQNIQTRLSNFLGDCFFAADTGVDWFNLLGSKKEISINIAISATVLNTEGITGITQLSLDLTTQRRLSVSYSANCIYGPVIRASVVPVLLLTEDSEVITTEDGDPISI